MDKESHQENFEEVMSPAEKTSPENVTESQRTKRYDIPNRKEYVEFTERITQALKKEFNLQVNIRGKTMTIPFLGRLSFAQDKMPGYSLGVWVQISFTCPTLVRKSRFAKVKAVPELKLDWTLDEMGIDSSIREQIRAKLTPAFLEWISSQPAGQTLEKVMDSPLSELEWYDQGTGSLRSATKPFDYKSLDIEVVKDYLAKEEENESDS